jgi:hypothetical protein
LNASRASSAGEATLYGVAILTGAALVFQIQPIAGKLLLPSFGGGASVWTACMFFFQSMLLAGYAYAHLLTRFSRPRSQVAVHALLLLLSMLFLPVGFAAAESDIAAQDPAVRILLALLASIGAPFVILASTAPLIQRWSTLTRPGRSPYRLYAMSNGGALFALLTYPLLVEPNLSLRTQAIVWSTGYGLFVAVMLAASGLVWRHRDAVIGPLYPQRENGAGRRVFSHLDALLTVLLSASGVVMLLAVTNEITQNVAPVPFLWVLPLTAYLLTYVICFGGERWYDRAVWGSLFIVSASSLIILHFFGTTFPIVPVIIAYLLVQFCACMVCHAELYRLRPQPGGLTVWYLLIALGGALGGAFVSVVAPSVFSRFWEALAGAYLIYFLFGMVVLRERRSTRKEKVTRPSAAMHARLERWGFRLFVLGWVTGLFLLPAVVTALNALRVKYDVASSRNFYGVLNVRDVGRDGSTRRILVDGTTIHGFQLLDDAGRKLPTSYYGAETGIALVMENIERPATGLRIGVVGLGTGTLAAYGRPGDSFRFYELNPAVIDAARQHFSYLRDTPASVDIVPGDGRISLQRELRQYGSRGYDVLVIDAFNSDAIPVHLLTLEALELYWSHLKPDGVLALHLTNNYLDLVSVASNLGSSLGKEVLFVTTPREVGVSSAADWVLLSRDAGVFAEKLPEEAAATELTMPGLERLWTDDYSNLLDALKPQD